MNSAKNIRKLREQAGLTQAELGEKLGITSVSVSQWETGKAVPRMHMIHKLAETFDVPISVIVGEDRVPLPRNARTVAPMRMATAPLLGRVHAGKPAEPDELARQVEVPAYLIEEDPDSYALEAEGDCMNLVYPEGCTIVISPNRQPVNGSVAVVSIDGRECVMRRMYRTASTLVLSPESSNPEHKDIVITSSDDVTVEFLGRVVWFQAAEEME